MNSDSAPNTSQPPTSPDVPGSPALDPARPDAPASCVSSPSQPIDWGRWVRRFLWYNPFFLVSVALMLYGVFRLSSDPVLFREESMNLIFCFLSLQLYGFLGIGTALLLARRKVYYDSALLVVLDQGLVLVPFLLISQAALLEARLGWELVIGAMASAGLRLAMVRRGYREFLFPDRLVILGMFVLLINGVVPMLLRSMVNLTSVDDWEGPNRLAWDWVLPLLAFSAVALPKPRRYGGLEAERSWIPMLIHGLWLAGTAVHAWSLAYISTQSVELSDLAPLMTATCWMLWFRSHDFFAAPPKVWRRVVWVAAFFAPWLALFHEGSFRNLTALNGLAFLVLSWVEEPRSRATARELAWASLTCFLASTPLVWWKNVFPGMGRPELVLLAVGIYLLLQCCRLRTSLAGLMASLVVMAGISALVPRGWAEPLALQTGIAFFLAHGLFWRRRGVTTAGRALRAIAAGTWVMTAWWQNPPLDWGVQTGVALEAAGVVMIWWWMTRGAVEPVEWAVPFGAVGAVLVPPIQWSFSHLTPGLSAVLASFVFFGLGIGAAWTRRHWTRAHSQTPGA